MEKCKRCKGLFTRIDGVDCPELCDQCLLKTHSSILLSYAPTSQPPSTRRSSGNGGYLHPSEGLGVNTKQVVGTREIYKKSGLGDIEFTPDGRPIFTSDKQMQDAGKALGRKNGRDGWDVGVDTGRVPEQKKQEMLKKYENLDVPVVL